MRALVAKVEIAVRRLPSVASTRLCWRHILQTAAERHSLQAPILTSAAERLILEQTWTDEARGLALVIERAVLLATDAVIDAAALSPAPPVALPQLVASAYNLAGNEKAVIAAALRDIHHNVTQAAAALGLSRGALYRRMERYGL